MHTRCSALVGLAAFAMVGASLLPLYAVPALTGAMPEDSGQLRLSVSDGPGEGAAARAYLFRGRLSRRLQTPVGVKWRVATVSAPLRAARGAIEAVVADTGTRAAVLVWYTARGQHSRQGIREAVPLRDSRASAVVAGGPHALSRCRAPYWPDALPWRIQVTGHSRGCVTVEEEMGEVWAARDDEMERG